MPENINFYKITTKTSYNSFSLHWCSTDRYKFSTCSNRSDMEFGFDYANNYNHISMGDHTVSSSIWNLCVRAGFTKRVFQKASFRFFENSEKANKFQIVP